MLLVCICVCFESAMHSSDAIDFFILILIELPFLIHSWLFDRQWLLQSIAMGKWKYLPLTSIDN